MKWILSLAIGMLVVACGEPTRNLTVTNSTPSTITDVKVNVNGRQFYPLGAVMDYFNNDVGHILGQGYAPFTVIKLLLFK